MKLPARSGTYTLVLRCEVESEVQIGRLGILWVKPGFYVYVGSAHGSGGLAARVVRHVKTNKTLHWYVDHLREVTDLAEVWYMADRHRNECRWATVLRKLPGSLLPMEQFGASDCSCRSHLFFFRAMPSIRNFRRRLGQSSSYGSPVSCLTADRLHESQARC
jgi:Uri superfamily endonuclease